MPQDVRGRSRRRPRAGSGASPEEAEARPATTGSEGRIRRRGVVKEGREVGTDGRGMRRGAKVPSRRRRDGRVRNERRGDLRARERVSARRFVCLQVKIHPLIGALVWSKVVFERIPIGRRVRARGAVGIPCRVRSPRVRFARRARVPLAVTRVSSVVTPSLLARADPSRPTARLLAPPDLRFTQQDLLPRGVRR